MSILLENIIKYYEDRIQEAYNVDEKKATQLLEEVLQDYDVELDLINEVEKLLI